MSIKIAMLAAAGVERTPVGKQGLLIYIKLSDDGFGASGEVFGYTAFEDQLYEQVQNKKVGELDGHDSGKGYLVLYFYGPSADRMFKAIEPTVRAKNLPAGSYVVKRYAGRGGRDVRIELTTGP